ncbi:MAG TPA: ABC transporter permease [Kofleriaceae bacterium]|jgi:ABC-2 type transport system permease protein
MNAALIIARRELLERIRSKWFVVITLLGPVAMVALVVIPVLVAGSAAKGSIVDIVDQSGSIAQPLAAELTTMGWKPTIVDAKTSDEVELAKIRHKEINGYVLVSPTALEGGPVIYSGDNGSSQFVTAEFMQAAAMVVHRVRGQKLGLAPEKLDQMLGPVNIVTNHTNGETIGSNGMAMMVVGLFLGFILYIVITLYGVNVLRSVVQEKTSRVMELLVATVRPTSLMTGKILGVGGAGLIQIVVWLGIGAIVTNYRGAILGHFGVHETAGMMAIPVLTAPILAIAIAYFVLGFFFYASLYAAAGACVSSEQDTQQASMPITLFLVLGMIFVQGLAGAPRSEASIVLSQVPFWSPMLMPIRYILGSASLGEVALSLGILAASLALVTRLAGKIYRVGVLMYGKRPSARELLRWLRY